MEIAIIDIEKAAKRIKKIAVKTPLQFSRRLSYKYNADIYLKREDLQDIRSFKIRGAYNKMSMLSKTEREKGVITASAGNHAQGVAYSCAALRIHGTIFMPTTAPAQKLAKVKYFGKEYITIELIGNTFDDAAKAAQEYCKSIAGVYIHTFDDKDIIAGQGTIGKEIYDELGSDVDIVIVAIGGGGLISGISSYLKKKLPTIQMIGIEPTGAASMNHSIKHDKVVGLSQIDTFVDGVAIKTVGNHTFAICKKYVNKIHVIDEGHVCDTMIDLYQFDGIIAEPAGALSVSALEKMKDQIKGKTVVCVISGGNNDLFRYPEVINRSFAYSSLGK